MVIAAKCSRIESNLAFVEAWICARFCAREDWPWVKRVTASSKRSMVACLVLWFDGDIGAGQAI